MEAHSRFYRLSIYAVEVAAGTLLFSLPLVTGFLILFATLLAGDMVRVLKPSYPAAKPLSESFFWICRVYGGILGIGMAASIQILDEAIISAKSLSVSYRNKMLKRWKKARARLEAKLGLPITDTDQEQKSLTAMA